MSTPGPDQNVPQGGRPQGQPGWEAPPPPTAPGYGAAPAWSGSPAGHGTSGRRPGQVTAAAIVGIVWGGLGSLFGLLGLIGASALEDLGLELSGLDIVLGAVGLAAAVALLAGGIGVLQGKAPRLLLLASYALVVLWVLGAIANVLQGYGFSEASLVGLAVVGAIVVLLLQPQSKQYFASRGQPV